MHCLIWVWQQGYLVNLITSVKQVNVSVSETGNTRLPGYMDSTQLRWTKLEQYAAGA